MIDNYGEAIKKARRKAGMTQQELASELGVSVVTVGRWEKGLRTPRRNMQNKIISAIDCRVLDKLENETSVEPSISNVETVNHPAHYQGKHECIDEMIALFGVEAVIHFCMCNVYKYRFRAANKNGKEDLDKADWYMDKLMELEGGTDD